MSKITFKQAKQSYEALSDNLWDDERTHYCEIYNVDSAPENIPTESLKNHNYSNLRVLNDYFNKRGK